MSFLSIPENRKKNQELGAQKAKHNQLYSNLETSFRGFFSISDLLIWKLELFPTKNWHDHKIKHSDYLSSDNG